MASRFVPGLSPRERVLSELLTFLLLAVAIGAVWGYALGLDGTFPVLAACGGGLVGLALGLLFGPLAHTFSLNLPAFAVLALSAVAVDLFLGVRDGWAIFALGSGVALAAGGGSALYLRLHPYLEERFPRWFSCRYRWQERIEVIRGALARAIVWGVPVRLAVSVGSQVQQISMLPKQIVGEGEKERVEGLRPSPGSNLESWDPVSIPLRSILRADLRQERRSHLQPW